MNEPTAGRRAGTAEAPPALAPLELTAEDRAELERWVRRRTSSQDRVLRARIVLACARCDGAGRPVPQSRVARELGVHVATVRKWRRRFAEGGLGALGDAPRPGRPRAVTQEQVAAVVRIAREEAPEGARHWSSRAAAARTGLSQSTVWRIWRAFGLRPHRGRGTARY